MTTTPMGNDMEHEDQSESPEVSEAADEEAVDSETQPAEEAAPKTVEEERDEFREKYLRSLADLENFRRRSAKERQELLRYAAERPLGELFPVFDNLQRAVEHASANPETIAQGVQMILSMAEQAFERMGVTKVGKAGDKFDPNLHEAFSQQASEEVERGHVIQIFEFGYRLHDKLLRAAKVVVSTGDGSEVPEPEPEQPATDQDDAPSMGHPTDDLPPSAEDEGSDLLSAAAADLDGWEPGGSADDDEDDSEIDVDVDIDVDVE